MINVDITPDAEIHIHRIGRTGRAGESGMAISFVSADTEAHFRLIEKRQHQSVPREQIADFEPVQIGTSTADAIASNGGVKGKRPSRKDKLREAAARGQSPHQE